MRTNYAKNKGQSCKTCRFFLSKKDVSDIPNEPIRVRSHTFYVGDSGGICLRFPTEIQKSQDDWCGEYKERG